MANRIKLKDGTEVLVRALTEADIEKSWSFFKSLPEEDRDYLRGDVTQRKLVEQRIRDTDTGAVKRLAALVNDEIVADGALELSGVGWKEHMAEVRLIISPDYQRQGLGTLMARELYTLASSAEVEELVVRMMRPQKAARSIFEKLGFKEMARIPEYVKDLKGKKQDMILMRCDLAALWRELEQQLADSDWRRMR